MAKMSRVTKADWDSFNSWNKMIIDEFLEQEHLANQTLSQYRSALRIFARWVRDFAENKPFHELKSRDALRYQNFLLKQNMSSDGLGFKRSSVSSLCNYIELYYGEDFPLFRNIYSKAIPKPAKARKREKVPLTKDQYLLLCNELEKREEWQMLAYLKFTYASGCRKGESRQLLKEVVDYEKVKDKEGNDKAFYQTHNIRTKGRGKEGKVRKLLFDEDAMIAIKKWLEIRGEDECPHMFVAKTKVGKVNQLSLQTFNYWASKTFTEILGQVVYPHLIRSTRATHIVVEDGKDIKTAQKILGHNDSSTTEIYVVRDDTDDVDDAF